MKMGHEAQAAEAGRRWAEQKADALEGTAAASWPLEWDPAWAGELRLRGASVDHGDLDALVDLANREAAFHWLELVEGRKAMEDTPEEIQDLEARAIRLFEALRGHMPQGLHVGREGARIFLQDVEGADEINVTSMAEASRVISDWQEHHLGR